MKKTKKKTKETTGFEVEQIENGIIKFTTHTELLGITPHQVYDFLINLNHERYKQFHSKDHKEYEVMYRPEKGIVGTIIYLKEEYENGYISSAKARFIEAKLDLCTPSFTQFILAEYMKRGKMRQKIEEAIQCYKPKIKVMLEALEKYMPEGVTWSKTVVVCSFGLNYLNI